MNNGVIPRVNVPGQSGGGDIINVCVDAKTGFAAVNVKVVQGDKN